MNTWEDIISLADTTFRNTFSTPTKVAWLSFIMAQLLQLKYSRDATFAFFDITEDIQDYDLPVDCEPEDIVSIQVETRADSQTYTDLVYQDLKELRSGDNYYTITNGMIHLGARPSESKLALVFYIGTPTLTEEQIGETVPLNLAYRELLVSGLCERMAAARGDVVRKNNFKSDFDSLLTDFLMNQLNNVPEYITPRDDLPKKAGR